MYFQVEDEVVSKLKDKAKRRKGRGFTGGRGEDRDEVKSYRYCSFLVFEHLEIRFQF